MPDWMIPVAVILLAWLCWAQVPYFRSNQPRRYDPHDIPANLLPTAEQEAQ